MEASSVNERLNNLALDFRESVRTNDVPRQNLLLKEIEKEIPGLSREQLEKAALIIAADILSRG